MNSCTLPTLRTLNGARVPYISQKSLLLNNFNINERVDTSPSREGCSELSTKIINIERFGTPLRLDRNKHGGCVIIYIRAHLPCKLLSFYNKPKDIGAIFSN